MVKAVKYSGCRGPTVALASSDRSPRATVRCHKLTQFEVGRRQIEFSPRTVRVLAPKKRLQRLERFLIVSARLRVPSTVALSSPRLLQYVA